MSIQSLEFVDPSGLSDIEEKMRDRIQNNERLLERKGKTSQRSVNTSSQLEEFRPSVIEREMEYIKPCIDKTSQYLRATDNQIKSSGRKRTVTGKESNKRAKVSLDEEKICSYPMEFIEKSEARRVCLGRCIQQIAVVKVDDISPGDHLVYQRPGYQHHAIVVSINKIDKFTADVIVIHKSGNAGDVFQGLIKYVLTIGQSSPKGRLMEEKFENVDVRSTCLFVVKYKTYPYTPEQIIQRARDQLDKSKSSEYNLANNNCEHIVTWCVTGEWYSDQINSLWINVRNRLKPFCEDTASLEKLEDMRRCELICDECYSKCKTGGEDKTMP
ncbi:uncharacterized protein LOC125676133 [Ostrea edulis]|uniref:uncharacterized protein LOC125676133 n=1 Tax=Ostrea edulis TaxID=37623 RepID=UPI0024AFBB68|nr:uncharacterized protein LOC125676133 [Ostrea edulis]XP_056015958.1 uncharacterized protein LOC125676133 [Ostrea edulis]